METYAVSMTEMQDTIFHMALCLQATYAEFHLCIQIDLLGSR
jgi:hypothetical protein